MLVLSVCFVSVFCLRVLSVCFLFICLPNIQINRLIFSAWEACLIAAWMSQFPFHLVGNIMSSLFCLWCWIKVDLKAKEMGIQTPCSWVREGWMWDRSYSKPALPFQMQGLLKYKEGNNSGPCKSKRAWWKQGGWSVNWVPAVYWNRRVNLEGRIQKDSGIEG